MSTSSLQQVHRHGNVARYQEGYRQAMGKSATVKLAGTGYGIVFSISSRRPDGGRLIMVDRTDQTSVHDLASEVSAEGSGHSAGRAFASC
ncbi:hypothetical protein [Streptomyces platensis]|uniref:hypothetical protein n=1 Tax=Streptomyces platensis TaxID=58346 RepID=UPI002E262CC3